MRTYGSGRNMNFGFGRLMTPAIKWLLIANFAVYFLQAFAFEPMVRLFAFIPRDAVMGLQIWRFATYMFLHVGFSHIAFNMFGLWMFGTQVERLWGSRTFLIYYFVCGLGGAAAYGAFNLAGMNAFSPMMGASGAVYGLLLAFGLSFPDAIILAFMIFPMKAKYFVALYGLIELLSIRSGSTIAHVAHLGGMLAGFIFLRTTVPALGGMTDIGGIWRRYQTKRRMRVVRPEDHSGKSGSRGGNGKNPDQAEIDRILEKISRQGLQSLSEKEQEVLRRAGRK